MKTIFGLTLKAAARDPFLLFWSILLPIGGTIGLGLTIQQADYPLRIMTGMMAAGVLFYALSTTAFAILGQRRRGVYSLLRTTPMPLWQYICGVSGAWTVVSLVCSLLLLAVGVMVLGIDISPVSAAMLLPTVWLGALGYVFLSFVLSALCKTEAHASIVTNLAAMPLLFGSSAFYTLDRAPEWLQAAARVNPFQWFTEGLRSAMTIQVTDWLLSMGVLLGLLLLALLLAVRTFRFSDV